MNAEKRIVKEYNYEDETGKLLYQVVRYEPKGFSQRKPSEAGGYIYNTQGVRKVLYKLPELIATPLDDWVFIVEGEKHTLEGNVSKEDFFAPRGMLQKFLEAISYFSGEH